MREQPEQPTWLQRPWGENEPQGRDQENCKLENLEGEGGA